jgi:hypothetical protein
MPSSMHVSRESQTICIAFINLSLVSFFFIQPIARVSAAKYNCLLATSQN